MISHVIIDRPRTFIPNERDIKMILVVELMKKKLTFFFAFLLKLLMK